MVARWLSGRWFWLLVGAAGLVVVMLMAGPVWAASDDSVTSPDTNGNVGMYASLVLDANGFPVVAYRDVTNGDLKVLHCDDPNCDGEGESITSPDTTGDVGWYASLVLDANGFPVVAYFDGTNQDLKVLHCDDPNCDGEGESITSPDTAGNVGAYASLVLDANGFPVVAYLDGTNQDLKVLHCDDPNCDGEGESITSPDTTGFVGWYASLVLDANGFPVVAYYDFTNGDLRVLHCDDPNCDGEGESITSPDTTGNVGLYASLVLDANGFPVVAYRDGTNQDLKLLH